MQRFIPSPILSEGKTRKCLNGSKRGIRVGPGNIPSHKRRGNLEFSTPASDGIYTIPCGLGCRRCAWGGVPHHWGAGTLWLWVAAFPSRYIPCLSILFPLGPLLSSLLSLPSMFLSSFVLLLPKLGPSSPNLGDPWPLYILSTWNLKKLSCIENKRQWLPKALVLNITRRSESIRKLKKCCLHLTPGDSNWIGLHRVWEFYKAPQEVLT